MIWRTFLLSAVVLAGNGVLAVAQARGQQSAPLTGGFADCLEPADGGRVDWTNGFILAEAVGLAEGVDKQQELLAQQAARTLAARNALALARGIRIDADGTVGDVRNGLIRVQGVVRGHEVVESQWLPDADPPQCRLVLRVPLWGATSVASVFAAAQQARCRQAGRERWALIVDRVDVSDFVLVLDARGVGARPCLYPVVSCDGGRTLYDVTTMRPQMAPGAAPVRYVTCEMSFDDLQVMVEDEQSQRYSLASYQGPGDQARERPAAEPTSRPTSQPAERKTSKRRAKRRMAARITQAGGNQKTQLVLTQQDAERLRRSPEAASALKNAQVIVVVDSAAAGIEGRLPTLSETLLAIASPRP